LNIWTTYATVQLLISLAACAFKERCT